MSSPPKMLALWWWIDRWRKSTAFTDMTLEEQGAYRNLLDEATLRGGVLPDDERILAKASGDATRWRVVRAAVMARFDRIEGGWQNLTLNEVLHQSNRRRVNQARYRARLAADNGRGHKPDNETVNGSDNTAAHNRDNKPDSPDPDQDPESKERSQAAAATGRSRARGIELERHVDHVEGFCDLVCLPQQKLDELVAASGGATAHDVVAWARQVRDAWADQPIDNSRPFAFWNDRWREATAPLVPTAQEQADHRQYAQSTATLGRPVPLLQFVEAKRRRAGTLGRTPRFVLTLEPTR